MLLATPMPTSSSKRGFTVELIDPFSPRSPIYDASLTETERIKLQTESDKHRLCYLSSILKINSSCINEINSGVIRPNKRGYFYMVVLDLGTGASRHTYLLEFDTGSGLTWTQCDPCHPMFHQEPPLFDPSRSPTYHYVPHDHPLCKPPTYHPDRNGHCEFRYGYADWAYAEGTFSFDTFTFAYGGAVGILGMNLDQESFIIQARDATGGRFSYCLFKAGVTDVMTLRFGDDISWPWMAHRQQTRILRYPEGLYNLNLIDISIGRTRMNFPPHTFKRKSSKKGGFIIDSGTVSSTLVPKAYKVFR
ncbi:Aspartic proteinase nepenthesin-2 [Rhynchospora pubera]|uniref:Aspartic proteinase nepenthesin-2 n=1 Tax=Rhynchospora pubera TaxID=906938 RepID=A0AAV8HWF8_9POAL|nr:Aspartic proteinase nepenthesin-2 [Rhynchospora pubera]